MGVVAQWVWETEMGSTGEGPVGGLGAEANAVCRHCLQILTAETVKIRKCGINRHPINRHQSALRWGAKRHFVGAEPQAHAWRRL